MNRRYVPALVAAGAGLGAVGWVLLTGTDAPPIALLMAAASAPLAVLLAVRGRLGGDRFPGRALAGGAVIGPVVALASHAFVFAFAYAFFQGFDQTGRKLLDSLRVDPRIIDVLASPWLLVLLVDVVAVAPLTEEAGKALGAGLFGARNRREAFLAGVAAGTGFAIVEDILYAVVGSAYGGPWAAIVLGRALGAAVHPLATGLVAMGWWEWKRDRKLVGLVKRFLTGAGIHALWNGSLVALLVVETAFRSGPSSDLGPVALAYSAAIGLALAGLLWTVTASLAADRDPFSRLELNDARAVAAWAVVGASLLVPVGLLILAFPGFYLG